MVTCMCSKANCRSTNPAGACVSRLCWARAKGGKVSATNNGLAIDAADEVTLIVSAGTSWKDKEFAKWARQRLDAALAKPFDAIREAAVADHRRLMERCQLTLPEAASRYSATFRWASKSLPYSVRPTLTSALSLPVSQ